MSWDGFDKGMKKAILALAVEKRRLLASVGEALVSGTIQRFEDEEDPQGKKWKESRRDGQTLTDSARLRNSITYATGPESVMVGTNVKYARIHQKGGVIKGKNGKKLKFEGDGGDVFRDSVTIPKRPYLGVSSEDEEEVLATIGQYLGKAFGGKSK